MKRIARWTLLVLAGLIAMAALFYAEEDWRGEHAWQACEATLAAKGETLDWNAYVPPPVPDAQNFFKAPKMADWFIKPDWHHPSLTNELTEQLKNEKTSPVVGDGCHIKTEEDARSYLAWSAQFEPDFDLIRKALKRPYARMDGDYSDPLYLPDLDFMAVRVVVQTLAQRAHCHLLLGQPEQALNELTLVNDSRRLLEAAPTDKPIWLVSAIIDAAVTQLYVGVIGDGLKSGDWGEPQLVALQNQLNEINLAPLMVNSFRLELARGCSTCKLTLRKYPHDLSLWQNLLHFRFFGLQWMPRGWAYQNMATVAKIDGEIVASVDLTNRLFVSQIADRVQQETKRLDQHSGPYSFIAAIAIPDLAKAEQLVAYNQTMVNEAQIACALERYRLVHGEHPEKLNSLTPQFIAQLPHDLIGGQPLVYRRTDNGKFLLYSIGWNDTDDGGRNSPQAKDGRFDYTQGDWVWKL